MINVILIILGLAVLIAGGEFLVKGAVGIAKQLHISTLVIGMTVVSFGTSAPELLVSLSAATSGNPEIAIGNVIGSNIANIALVLAITVLIFPLFVDKISIRQDWSMMFFASILFYIFSYDGIIERWEGLVLFLILVTFTYYLIAKSRRNTKKEELVVQMDENTVSSNKRYLSLFYIALGLVGLYFGAEWLLEGAVGIALDAGMEKRIVGITIVAFGTSVPELVTCGVAAYRKESDISIGNLIGSNIFNIMAVIGITSMIAPIGVSYEAINFDMIWMMGIALLLLPMMIIGKKMGLIHGLILISIYITYITILVISTIN